MQIRKPTKNSRSTTLRLVMGGQEQKGDVSSPFGPLKVGLIHTQDHYTQTESREAQLLELLSCLEKRILELNTKYSEVCATFLNDTAHLAKLSISITSTAGTDE